MILVVLHVIKRSVPYTNRVGDLIRKLVNRGFVIDSDTVSKLMKKVSTGGNIDNPLSIEWDGRGKKRKHDGRRLGCQLLSFDSLSSSLQK